MLKEKLSKIKEVETEAADVVEAAGLTANQILTHAHDSAAKSLEEAARAAKAQADAILADYNTKIDALVAEIEAGCRVDVERVRAGSSAAVERAAGMIVNSIKKRLVG